MRKVLVLVVMLAAPAAAEPLKVAREPQDAAAGGPSAITGISGTGWFARAEIEAFFALPTSWKAGPAFGMNEGLEVWNDGDQWGFGWPIAVMGGLRVPGVRVLGGVGIDWIGAYHDPMAGTQIAARAFALANASVDIEGVRVGVDARMGRHFVDNVPDFNRWELGISLGYTWPARHNL